MSQFAQNMIRTNSKQITKKTSVHNGMGKNQRSQISRGGSGGDGKSAVGGPMALKDALVNMPSMYEQQFPEPPQMLS